jgi:hypothetical protein
MPGVAVLEPARMAQGLSAFGRLPAHLHSYRNVFNNSVTERTLLLATRSFRGNGNDKPRKSSEALVCLPGLRLGGGPYFNALTSASARTQSSRLWPSLRPRSAYSRTLDGGLSSSRFGCLLVGTFLDLLQGSVQHEQFDSALSH